MTVITCTLCHRPICRCPIGVMTCEHHRWFKAKGPLGALHELSEMHQRRHGEHQIIIKALDPAT